MSKFANGMDKIANGVTTGYKKIEGGVVSGYQKIENAVVKTFLTREGETPEEAKARMAKEQQERDEKQKEMIEKSLEASRNAGKQN